jgi:hypothetical protein
MEILPLIKERLPHLRMLEPEWLDEMIIRDLKSYMQQQA